LLRALQDWRRSFLLESLLNNRRLVGRHALKLDRSLVRFVTIVVTASQAIERRLERHISPQTLLISTVHLQRRFATWRNVSARDGLVLMPTARPATGSRRVARIARRWWGQRIGSLWVLWRCRGLFRGGHGCCLSGRLRSPSLAFLP
jgi:hypothetical protein